MRGSTAAACGKAGIEECQKLGGIESAQCKIMEELLEEGGPLGVAHYS